MNSNNFEGIQNVNFINKEDQSPFDELSTFFVDCSIQILRLYSCYLEEKQVEEYFNKLISRYMNEQQVNYGKILLLFSSLPKSLLELLNYEQSI